MGYRSLRECTTDLERHGRLVRIATEVDPHLELAEIQRRAYLSEAPALLFDNLTGSPFSAVGNLFGTLDRARFIFRDTLARVRRIVQLKASPAEFWRAPWSSMAAGVNALSSLPKPVRSGPVLAHQTELSQLPAIQSWPDDGGPFITLPQVYTERSENRYFMSSNIGMYRIQLAGNEYQPGREVGLHYQIHRGIGIHHSAAVEAGKPLPVSVFVGGPPAHTLAAVMPLPEALSELLFGGMLAGRRFRLVRDGESVISADADFCLVGRIDPNCTKPEGPFGDHLGYYSLAHDFPVMQVDRVFHRRDPIWPFTVVGRPPQEDTTFGQLIHEITAPMVPVELPGVKAIHAVDAAGVHPLLLAIAQERYVPYQDRQPQEILTAANAILGFGQASLAKYLWIAAQQDDPSLDLHDVPTFLSHVLRRVDWTRDLHFQTRTTIDTLDYSGTGLNSGSKLVVAAAGDARRTLADRLPSGFRLPANYREVKPVQPGVLAIRGPDFRDHEAAMEEIRELSESQRGRNLVDSFPLWILVDDVDFVFESFRNFAWVTFTRSNPSHDVHGIESFVDHKHWGCHGPLVIDARLKPHHAPPLIEDPEVKRRVDTLCARGGPLEGVIE